MTTETILEQQPKAKTSKRKTKVGTVAKKVELNKSLITEVGDEVTSQDTALEIKAIVESKIENKTEVQAEPKLKTTVEPKVKPAVAVKGEEQAETSVKNTVAAQNENPVRVYDTIVVGAGISGIAAAVKMKKAGYDNYVVLEKAARVGGTWRENTYP